VQRIDVCRVKLMVIATKNSSYRTGQSSDLG